MNHENLNTWNLIYSHFDPVALHIFGLSLHWYGIAYVSALLITFYMAKYFVAKNQNQFPINTKMLEIFFIYAEIGVILGARLGYILIYDPNTSYYLTHPWQIFNPFDSQGSFIGIRGMSYHGAIIGFLIASLIFAKIYKLSFLMLLDLIALSVPLGYVFGRIGNFLNQELFGRPIPEGSPWECVGIMVDSTLRYPSQLIEAFLEGIVVFLCLLYIKTKKPANGILIASYGLLYSLARFIAEYFREPDSQMGVFIFGLSMGQILSIIMIVVSISILIYALAFKQR